LNIKVQKPNIENAFGVGNYGVMEISETGGGGTISDIIKKYSDEFKPVRNIPDYRKRRKI
jgi:hypothetical protein